MDDDELDTAGITSMRVGFGLTMELKWTIKIVEVSMNHYLERAWRITFMMMKVSSKATTMVINASIAMSIDRLLSTSADSSSSVWVWVWFK